MYRQHRRGSQRPQQSLIVPRGHTGPEASWYRRQERFAIQAAMLFGTAVAITKRWRLKPD
jgi:hypothetical protein